MMSTIARIVSTQLEQRTNPNYRGMCPRITIIVKQKFLNKILKCTQNHRTMKIPFDIYVDTEPLLEKIS